MELALSPSRLAEEEMAELIFWKVFVSLCRSFEARVCALMCPRWCVRLCANRPAFKVALQRQQGKLFTTWLVIKCKYASVGALSKAPSLGSWLRWLWMCAVIASVQTEILCGGRTAAERAEGNHAVLYARKSCSWSEGKQRTHKVQGNHQRGEKDRVAAHTDTHTCAQQTTVESHQSAFAGENTRVFPLPQTLSNNKISSWAQITNICSLFRGQRPRQHLPRAGIWAVRPFSSYSVAV